MGAAGNPHKFFAYERRGADVTEVMRREGTCAAVDEGVAMSGRLDIILGNAGVCTYGELSTMDIATWQEMIDIDLTGVWMTVRAGVKYMIDAGNGGAIVLTSSTAGLRNLSQIGHYVAAKHGVTGLAKAFANELAPPQYSGEFASSEQLPYPDDDELGGPQDVPA